MLAWYGCCVSSQECDEPRRIRCDYGRGPMIESNVFGGSYRPSTICSNSNIHIPGTLYYTYIHTPLSYIHMHNARERSIRSLLSDETPFSAGILYLHIYNKL